MQLYVPRTQKSSSHFFPNREGPPADDMEVAGLTLAVLGEVRTIGNSIIARIARFKEAPSRFSSVCASVTRLVITVHDIIAIGKDNSSSFPAEIVHLFYVSITSVRDSLFTMETKLKQYDIRPACGAYSFFRASSCSERIAAIEQEAKEAEGKVQFLLMQLTVILTGRKMSKSIVTSEQNRMSSDVYHPGTNSPCLPFVLHDGPTFISKNDFLKTRVLTELSFEMDTGARDVCLTGLSCNGKKNALLGLAHDEDIRDRFLGGILYISLGPEASGRTLLQALARIMRATGAVSRASAVETMYSVTDGVSGAAAWFRGKACLFLVSDVYPTQDKEVGFLPEIQNLLHGSPESRVVLSSKFRSLAANSGLTVDVECADTRGDTCASIFLGHVGRHCLIFQVISDSPSMRAILEQCDHCPVSVALAGSAVGFKMKSGMNFEDACGQYLEDLLLRRDKTSSILEDLINLNLCYLDCELQRLAETSGSYVRCSHSIVDLYSSLVVLESGQRVTFLILSRLWDVTEPTAEKVGQLFYSVGLVTLVSETGDNGQSISGLFVHDSLREYCLRMAVVSEQKSAWDLRLLSVLKRDSAWLAT